MAAFPHFLECRGEDDEKEDDNDGESDSLSSLGPGGLNEVGEDDDKEDNDGESDSLSSLGLGGSKQPEPRSKKPTFSLTSSAVIGTKSVMRPTLRMKTGCFSRGMLFEKLLATWSSITI